MLGDRELPDMQWTNAFDPGEVLTVSKKAAHSSKEGGGPRGAEEDS